MGEPVGFASHGNEVYIAVMELNEKTRKSFADIGHIQQYRTSIDGKYKRCIIKGIIGQLVLQHPMISYTC